MLPDIPLLEKAYLCHTNCTQAVSHQHPLLLCSEQNKFLELTPPPCGDLTLDKLCHCKSCVQMLLFVDCFFPALSAPALPGLRWKSCVMETQWLNLNRATSFVYLLSFHKRTASERAMIMISSHRKGRFTWLNTLEVALLKLAHDKVSLPLCES